MNEFSPGAKLAQAPASKREVAGYFVVTFALSWAGALAVVASHLIRGEAIPKFAGIMMFPVMLLGPAVSGIVFSARGEVIRRFTRPFASRWLAVLLVPPVLIAAVLGTLTLTLSRAYAPNHFLLGLSFGLTAGFLEEIGWSGFAFPAMSQHTSGFRAALLLGLLWSLWHLPVVDYLGTVTPHGSYWAAYFLAFAAAMTAMRVIICWVLANTGSLLLAQLLHTISTGALVVLSPTRVTGAQESAWYFVYAAALWLLVAVVRQTFGMNLILRQEGAGPASPSALSASRR